MKTDMNFYETVRTLLKLLFVLVCLTAVLWFLDQDIRQISKDVKSGRAVLSCQFNDGWREVPAHRFVRLHTDPTLWEFTNGHAQNCELKYQHADLQPLH